MVPNPRFWRSTSDVTEMDTDYILKNIMNLSSKKENLGEWTCSVIRAPHNDSLTSCAKRNSEYYPTETEIESTKKHALEIIGNFLDKKIKSEQEMPNVNAAVKEIISDKHNVKYHQCLETNITVSDKHVAKSNAKEELPDKKRKFKIGKLYTLKSKTKVADHRVTRTYQLKQIVWTMCDVQINGLVVKQVAGPDNHATAFLSINDCKNLHVKYEAGLQILPMSLNWQEKKNQ